MGPRGLPLASELGWKWPHLLLQAPAPGMDNSTPPCPATASAPPTRTGIRQWRLQGAAMGPGHARAFSTSAVLCEGSTEDEVTASSEPISLLVRLPGSTSFEVIDTAGPLVGHVKKAIIAEFGLDVKPDQVVLRLEGNDTPLEPMRTLGEAGLLKAGKIKLAVELAAAAQTPVAGGHSMRLRGRKFTLDGAMEPADAERYYLLPPDNTHLEEHVAERSFFMLYGPPGAGKTTAALHLLEHAEREHGLRPLMLDFCSINMLTTRDAFWRSICKELLREAGRHGISMEPFDGVSGFVKAFTKKSLGGERVILMLDEFDKLGRAVEGMKEELLGAMHTIKHGGSSYGVQCIFAVGTSSIVFMRDQPCFDAVPAHFFTDEEVAELLGQFTTAKGISLEAGVVENIHELTAGHAELVCACGRALESASGLQQDGHVTLDAWLDFRVRHMIDMVVRWPTFGRMADSVSKMSNSARQVLELAIMARDEPLQLSAARADLTNAARHLAAEGWLVAAGDIDTDSYLCASPLVRRLAMYRLADERRW